MRTATVLESIADEMKHTLKQRIDFCRGIMNIFGKPNTLIVAMEAAKIEAEQRNRSEEISNPDIAELLILQAQSSAADQLMFITWDKVEKKGEI